MVRFLIITQPRSGSAWFMSSLNSHPRIHCPRHPTLFSKHNLSPFKRFKPNFLQVDKPVSPYYKYRSASLKRRVAHWLKRDKLICEFLSGLYAQDREADAVGFKVNYSQINRYPVIVSWIKENNLRIIHLIRSNLLKRLVSHKVANIRDLRHSTRSVDTTRVHIEPSILVEDFRRRQNRFARYRERFTVDFKKPFLEVEYESLLADFESEMRRVLQFFEIEEFMPLTSELVKVNPNSLADIVENYDEVEQALTGTEFEHFLD